MELDDHNGFLELQVGRIRGATQEHKCFKTFYKLYKNVCVITLPSSRGRKRFPSAGLDQV